MTETTAKSGASGAPANPVDETPAKNGESATGRAVVGRAAVAADAPSPKFTRAPGMTPPPDEPPAGADGKSEAAKPAASAKPDTAAKPDARPAGDGAGSKGTASVPLVSKAKKAVAAAKDVAAGAAATAAGAVKKDTTPTGTSRPGGPTVTRPGGATGTRPGTTGISGAASGSAAVGAARVTEAVRAARSAVSSAATRGPRRARLNLKRIDPWSVMKFSFAVSVVLFIVVVVATAVLYLALDAMGVWESVNGTLGELLNNAGGNANSTPFTVTAWGVIGTSMLIGAVNVVLFTALATLGAFIYNVCADLVGGIELTLAERD
ncbi:DUF3566 domain-containing protein [Spirilliplanes yamanashiensis]|uniref:DUF3566 domain-containing protein n=1 Tax=Spirilliplanes yamanashiensis TaxID=42233 RepID=A0A8J3Y759_9ACTN|nr:DUF3566 domain-containing protein [Spirilliplanes yamanashiensis]MDP9814963.1 hypothetical protein [Spirilliplanes yamanashiensis]GIJ02619.1 hypothetical protein Sya03_19710 [Spirilliplanes yamanashiensis]